MTPFSLVVKKRTIVRIDVVKKRSYVGPILLLDATAARSLARILVPAKLRIFATPMLGDRPSYEFRKSAYLSTCTIVRAMVICQRVCPVGHHVPSPACVVSSVPVSVPLAAACPAPRVLCPLSPCLSCWPPSAQPRVCCVLCHRVCPVGRRVPSPACVVSSVPVSVLLAAVCPAPRVLCHLSPCLSCWPPCAQPRVCCVLCHRVCPVGRRVPSPACVVSSVPVSVLLAAVCPGRVCRVLCHRVCPVGRRVPSPACVVSSVTVSVLLAAVCPAPRVLCPLSPCLSCWPPRAQPRVCCLLYHRVCPVGRRVPSPACVVSSVTVSVLLAAACPAPRVLCPLSPCLSCWPPRAQPRVCCVLCPRVCPVGRRVPSPACVVSSVTVSVLLAAACPAPRVLCPVTVSVLLAAVCPAPRVLCPLSPCLSCWPPRAQPRVCRVLCHRVCPVGRRVPSPACVVSSVPVSVLLAAACPAPRVSCPLSPCPSCWPPRAQPRVCCVLCHRVRPVGRRVPSPACVVSSVTVSVLLAAACPAPRVLCPLSPCLSCWPPCAQPRVCRVLCHRVCPVGRRVPSPACVVSSVTVSVLLAAVCPAPRVWCPLSPCLSCWPPRAQPRVCRVLCHRVCPVGRRVPSPACVVSSVPVSVLLAAACPAPRVLCPLSPCLSCWPPRAQPRVCCVLCPRVCPVGRRVPSPACVVSSVTVSVLLAAACPAPRVLCPLSPCPSCWPPRAQPRVCCVLCPRVCPVGRRVPSPACVVSSVTVSVLLAAVCPAPRVCVLCHRVRPVGRRVPSPACVVSSVTVSVLLAAACPAPRVSCPLSPCLSCWPPRAQPRVCCVLCPRVCPVGRRVPSPACVVSSVPVSVLLAAACPAPRVLCPLSPCLSCWPPRAQPRVCCVLCPRVCPVGRRVPSPACVVSSVTVSVLLAAVCPAPRVLCPLSPMSVLLAAACPAPRVSCPLSPCLSCWPPCAQPRVCCVLCHRVRPVGRRVPSPACVVSSVPVSVLLAAACPAPRVLCPLSPCPSCWPPCAQPRVCCVLCHRVCPVGRRVPSPACVVSSVPVSVLLAAACPAPRVLCPLSPCLSCWPPRAQPRVCRVLCHRVCPVGRRVPSPACVVSSVPVSVLLAAACPAPRVSCPLSPCLSCWPPRAQPRVCCVICHRVRPVGRRVPSPACVVSSVPVSVLLAAACPAPRVSCHLSPCLSCWPPRAQPRVCCVLCHRVCPVGRRVPSPACVVSSVTVSVLLAAVCPAPRVLCPLSPCLSCWPPRAQPRVCRVLCHRVCPVGRRVPSPACVVSSVPVSVLLAAACPAPRVSCPLSPCLSCWPPRAQPRVCCVLCPRVCPVGRRVPSPACVVSSVPVSVLLAAACPAPRVLCPLSPCLSCWPPCAQPRVCCVLCHRVCPVGRRVPSPACVVSSVPVSVLLAAACPAPRVLCPLSPCPSCWPPRAQPRVCRVLCHRVCPVGRRVPSPACVVSSVTVSVLLAAVCPAPRVSCRQEGTTPLVLAAANNHFDCVKELLKQGADPASRRLVSTPAPRVLCPHTDPASRRLVSTPDTQTRPHADS